MGYPFGLSKEIWELALELFWGGKSDKCGSFTILKMFFGSWRQIIQVKTFGKTLKTSKRKWSFTLLSSYSKVMVALLSELYGKLRISNLSMDESWMNRCWIVSLGMGWMVEGDTGMNCWIMSLQKWWTGHKAMVSYNW